MKILITGADVEKNGDVYEVIVEKNGDVYEVIYQGRVVMQDKLRDVCLITALSKEKLDQLAGNNVLKFRTD